MTLLGPTGDSIEVWLRARDAARFQAEMKQSAAAVESVGAAGKAASAGGLATMKTQATSLGKELTKVGSKLNGVGKDLRSAGRSWTRHLTVPIVAVGAASTMMAIHFDRDMTQIQTQAGASAREVAGFRKEVLRMAGHDVMQGPQDLAQGLFHLRSIGLKGRQAIDALRVSADGAAVGNANLEETATALGSAWLVNIKGAGGLHHTMATLNATVGAGNMRFSDLIHALGTGLLPASKVAGLGLKDTMAALAIFTDEGYSASSAAAQFSTALHFLYNPTQKASNALKEIGLTNDRLALDMHKPKGLLVALRDLKTHLESAGGAGAKFKMKMDPLTGKKTLALDSKGAPIPLNRSAVKQEQILGNILPGGRGRIMLTLINQLDRYGMKWGQITKLIEQYNAAVARTKQTPAYKLRAAWATVQKTLTELGAALIPIVVPALQKMAHWVESLGNWFGKLSPTQKKVVLGFAGFLAVIGPLLSMIGFMTIGIGGLATALGFLAANPIVLIVIGIVALGVALFVAYKKVKWFHDAVNAVFKFLWKHWPLLVPIVMTLVGPIGVAILLFIKFRKQAVGAFKALKGAVGDAVHWSVARLRDFMKFLGRVAHRIESIPGVKQALSAGAEAAKGAAKLLGLAKGGVVTRRGFAVVGEDGPEILKLNRGDAVAPFSAKARPMEAPILGLASGGVITRGGAAIVGEGGPELFGPSPFSGDVRPLPAISGVGPQSHLKGGTVAPIDPNITVHVADDRPIVLKINGREIARATADDTEARLARR